MINHNFKRAQVYYELSSSAKLIEHRVTPQSRHASKRYTNQPTRYTKKPSRPELGDDRYGRATIIRLRHDPEPNAAAVPSQQLAGGRLRRWYPWSFWRVLWTLYQSMRKRRRGDAQSHPMGARTPARPKNLLHRAQRL